MAVDKRAICDVETADGQSLPRDPDDKSTVICVQAALKDKDGNYFQKDDELIRCAVDLAGVPFPTDGNGNQVIPPAGDTSANTFVTFVADAETGVATFTSADGEAEVDVCMAPCEDTVLVDLTIRPSNPAIPEEAGGCLTIGATDSAGNTISSTIFEAEFRAVVEKLGLGPADELGGGTVATEADGTITINLTSLDGTASTATFNPFPPISVNNGAFGVSDDYVDEILLHEGNITDGTGITDATPVVKTDDGLLGVVVPPAAGEVGGGQVVTDEVTGEVAISLVDVNGTATNATITPGVVPTVNDGGFGNGAPYDGEILLHEGNVADGTLVNPDEVEVVDVWKLADGRLVAGPISVAGAELGGGVIAVDPDTGEVTITVTSIAGVETTHTFEETCCLQSRACDPDGNFVIVSTSVANGVLGDVSYFNEADLTVFTGDPASLVPCPEFELTKCDGTAFDPTTGQIIDTTAFQAASSVSYDGAPQKLIGFDENGTCTVFDLRDGHSQDPATGEITLTSYDGTTVVISPGGADIGEATVTDNGTANTATITAVDTAGVATTAEVIARLLKNTGAIGVSGPLDPSVDIIRTDSNLEPWPYPDLSCSRPVYKADDGKEYVVDEDWILAEGQLNEPLIGDLALTTAGDGAVDVWTSVGEIVWTNTHPHLDAQVVVDARFAGPGFEASSGARGEIQSYFDSTFGAPQMSRHFFRTAPSDDYDVISVNGSVEKQNIAATAPGATRAAGGRIRVAWSGGAAAGSTLTPRMSGTMYFSFVGHTI